MSSAVPAEGGSARRFLMKIQRSLTARSAASLRLPVVAAPAVAELLRDAAAPWYRECREYRPTSSHSRVVRSISSLETLETYVQNLCDAQPDQAKVIIDAASMKAAAVGTHHKPELAATNGPVSGSVILVVNRDVLTGDSTKSTFINWQYSLDGKTWTSVPSTLRAKTQIGGLPPLTTVSFRASATSTNDVATPWTQAVTLLVQ